MGVKSEMSTYSFWILVIQTLLLAGAGAYVYLFGVPASFKRYMQDELLENLGDSVAKDYLKKGMGAIPDSDREDVQAMRKQMKGKVPDGVGDIGNKLGDLTGKK